MLTRDKNELKQNNFLKKNHDRTVGSNSDPKTQQARASGMHHHYLYPTCIQRPRRELPRRKFVKIFDAAKNRMIWLPYGEKTMTIC